MVIDPDARRHTKTAARPIRAVPDCSDLGGLSVARVTKGVATALGRALAVDRDTDLPDQLASLVERLNQGPLGQTQLKPRRVA